MSPLDSWQAFDGHPPEEKCAMCIKEGIHTVDESDNVYCTDHAEKVYKELYGKI